jgi:hypothetical protein
VDCPSIGSGMSARLVIVNWTSERGFEMIKEDVRIGMQLTVNIPMSAELRGKCHHNGHIGCIACNDFKSFPRYRIVKPGMLGTVASVNVPAVTRNKIFVCLDFTIDGHVYRTRPWYHQLRK